ncbi:BTAD domain-containing putative transcriptional regulator [Streptomyces sp. NPDC020490]|uniref:AfsR/SARP family transcriptional regulator n=1 Tax=Streptomyces sp. NPDC020490 TaxID=3365078 RepID=UPI0037A59D51
MLRLQVLGSMEAHAGGERVALGGPQQRAVLAMLLTARGSVVPAERITDRLWRRTPHHRARTALQPLISHLRRALEPERPPRAPSKVLPSTPPGYAVRLPEDSVDAWRFEAAVRRARSDEPDRAWHRLRDALSWWQGPAYCEWADHDWAVAEVARLDEMRLMAHELLLRAGLEAGRAAEVVLSAETLVRDAPLREHAWFMLALALWAGGRQSDALGALRRARAVLMETVGVAPGPELVELERSILRGEREVLHHAVPLPGRDGDGPRRRVGTRADAPPPHRRIPALQAWA